MRKPLDEQQHAFISSLPALYGDALMHYAIRFLGYRPHLMHIAEDAVQETYLKAIQHVDALMQHGNVAAWLMLCLKRNLLNRLRAASHQREELHAEPNTHPAATVQALASALERWQQAVSLQDVQEVAAALLTKEELRTFDDHFLHGYTAAEAALLEDVPAPTVRSRIFRIRKKLKNILETCAFCCFSFVIVSGGDWMNRAHDSLQTLQSAIAEGSITPADVENRLAALIEAEYGKDQPCIAFINACESLLQEIRTGGSQPFVSRVKEDEAFLRARTKMTCRSGGSVWRKGFAVAAVLVLLAAFGVTQGRLAWMSGESSPDGEQYILTGHEIDLEFVQGAIADHQQTDYLITESLEELTAFLGYCPALPDPEILGAAVDQYEVIAEPYCVLMTVLYKREDGSTVVYRVEHLANAEEARIAFEQSGQGVEQSICGTQVYCSMNYDKPGFTWTKGLSVYHLGGSMAPDAGLEAVRRLIEEMQSSR